MKSVKELKNPDIIEINGAKYQVLEGIMPHSILYHKDRDDVEWGVDLVKLGEQTITATHQLRYFSKKVTEIRFYELGKQDKEIAIKSIRF